MKKFVSMVAVFIALAVVTIAGVSYYMIKTDKSDQEKAVLRVEELTKMKINDVKVVKCDDTRDGWFGDGVRTVIIDFKNNEFKDNISKNKRMKKLPFPPNLQKFFYKNNNGQLNVSVDDNGKELIPKVKNGYYLFVNRKNNEDNMDDSKFLNDYSHDFSIVLFDSDTNRLYFVEYDS